MKIKNRRKNKAARIIRRSLILVSLIGILILSFKVGVQYGSKKIQSNENARESQSARDRNIKTQTVKKEETPDIKSSGTANSEREEYSYDVKKVRDILKNKEKSDGKKIVFLTFDDGPSVTVTPKVLDVLKEYNVKATFCLVGKLAASDQKSKDLVMRIYKEGHALGNHTYSHSLQILYPNNKIDIKNVIGEIEKTNTIIKNIVGQDFHTRVVRIPGGDISREYYRDPNLSELTLELERKEMYSIDWNAYDFDSEGNKKNAAELLNEVKKSVGTKEKVVLLMHDTYGKEETAKALPQIIEYLKGQGYGFKTIS